MLSRRSAKRPAWRSALGVAVFSLACARAGAFEPSVNYMLQCMGCHTPDGRGEPGHVPSVRNTLTPLSSSPQGRKFLIQVPGSAQSKLTDAELAEVLNWMVNNLSENPKPEAFKRFTASEVAQYRRTPLVAVAAVRKQLVASMGLE